MGFQQEVSKRSVLALRQLLQADGPLGDRTLPPAHFQRHEVQEI
jgi:hypothetical protein